MTIQVRASVQPVAMKQLGYVIISTCLMGHIATTTMRIHLETHVHLVSALVMIHALDSTVRVLDGASVILWERAMGFPSSWRGVRLLLHLLEHLAQTLMTRQEVMFVTILVFVMVFPSVEA